MENCITIMKVLNDVLTLIFEQTNDAIKIKFLVRIELGLKIL